jgi:hypothetical protein
MQRVSDVHVDHLLALAVFPTLELLDQRLALGQGELARDQLAGFLMTRPSRVTTIVRMTLRSLPASGGRALRLSRILCAARRARSARRRGRWRRHRKRGGWAASRRSIFDSARPSPAPPAPTSATSKQGERSTRSISVRRSLLTCPRAVPPARGRTASPCPTHDPAGSSARAHHAGNFRRARAITRSGDRRRDLRFNPGICSASS